MPHVYLLDTNIISDLIKHPRGKCFSKISEVGEEKICTSVVVACELRFGVAKGNSSRLRERVELVLDLIPILPLTSTVELPYAEIRTQLEKQGTPIGGNDLLIAAHALSLTSVMDQNLADIS